MAAIVVHVGLSVNCIKKLLMKVTVQNAKTEYRKGVTTSESSFNEHTTEMV